MRESDLRRQVRESLPAVHWQAVETGGTGRGIPDLNGCLRGVEFWVELKLVKRGLQVPLTPTQVAWHLRRARAGGRTWLLVRWRDRLLLYRGSRAAEVAGLGVKALPDLDSPCHGVPWEKILETMTEVEAP